MAIPAEGGLVRQYTAAFGDSDAAGTAKDIYFTQDGSKDTADLTPEMQGQGAAVFVHNPSTESAVTVELYTTVKIYGTDYEVKLGEINVAAGKDAGYSVGYGLLKKGLRAHVTNETDLTKATNVVVAIVPSNG